MKWGRITALLMAVGLLSGCGGTALPYAREMGDMALLRTMGVDAGTRASGVALTVSTGKRVSGLQGEQKPSLILAAERDSLSGACLAMQGLSDSYVFFGYVDQLLLGEDLAKRGIFPVLEYVSRDMELGLGAQLWLVRGATAKEAVQAGGEQGVDSRLSTMQTDSEMGTAGITRTAVDVFRDLLELGSAYLPALSVEGEQGEGETALLEHGYGILKQGQLVGYLDGEAARGLELLAEQETTDVLEIPLDAAQTVARLAGTEVCWTPIYQGNELKEVQLVCRVRADLKEVSRPLNRDELKRFKEELEQREEIRVQGALQQLQRWGTDCIGLGQRLNMADPEGWRTKTTPWEDTFPSVPVEVTVEVTVDRAYGDLQRK